MAIAHIAWDWNGTLFDDGDALVAATVDAFAACGLPEVTLDRYRTFVRRPISDFYERLAGRTLSPDEHAELEARFDECYSSRSAAATIRADALAALTMWRDAGRTQSLLSLHPHDDLLALPQLQPIAEFFVRIEGRAVDDAPRKAPLLRRHVAALPSTDVLVIGDSIDDVHAARECDLPVVLYHPSDRALVSEARVRELGVPMAADLSSAVALALADTTAQVRS